MIPGPLKSVYRQYKEDTNYVASWLATTAKACGYPSDLLSETTLVTENATTTDSTSTKSASSERRPKGNKGRGKKKKPNRATNPTGSQTTEPQDAGPRKYIVAVKEFLPLAQFISTSKAKVPVSFVAALNGVIAVRSEFTAKLSAHGSKTNLHSDLSHAHFVGVLDEVREVLRPQMTPEAAQASNEKSDNLKNRFEGLSIDEPSEAFLNAPDVARPQVVYEAESTMSERDAVFFLGLVLQDLVQIRLSIKGIWMKYAMEEYELVAAGVASNTALDLARHIIDEAMPELEMQPNGFYGVLKNHHVLTCELATWLKDEEQLKAFDLSPNPGEAELKYVSGSWSYVNAYNILAGLLPVMTNKPIGPIIQRNDQLESGKKYKRYAHDHDILKHIFEDLLIIAEYIKMDWPVEDNLLRGLKETLQTGKIPFYLVFTSQIVLDVYHATEDISSAEDAMLDMFGTFHTMFEMFGKYFSVLKKTDMFEKMDKIDFKTRAVVKETQELMEDIILPKKRELMNRKSGKSITLMTTPEEHSLFKRHPIMCGLCVYLYQMVLYRSAVNGANATRSIVSVYHLYNALFAEGFLDTPWADLDAVMRWIEAKDLYVGGEFPSTGPDGYAKAFMLQLGFSASLFMDPLKKRGNPLRPDKLMRAAPLRLIPQGPPTMTAFVDRYMVNQGLTGAETWTTEDVLKIVTEGEAEKIKKEAEIAKAMGEEDSQDPDQSRRETGETGKREAASDNPDTVLKGKPNKGKSNSTGKKADRKKGKESDGAPDPFKHALDTY
ncbi:ank-repeat protein mbp1 [Colletotrichum karsti]|uniref:Ank-repeat protein mbp1 n=1 Tax=Colletotrichum karsti TaxID=1095194 RepID=A0A9P6I9W6_9PEZI|nr:ank-repeat protein mbp1 [Colletotrichum karsti]KAF9878649.1 ank-repeat protein mbp1 [Colletotrichum karsti]